MASEIAQRFYDLLRKHFETGVPWQNMAFTDEQKKRVEVCWMRTSALRRARS